jgi:thioredoxin 1
VEAFVGLFVEIEDTSFENEVLQSPVPVLVEFGAEWCGPCRQMEPILEQYADHWQGKLRLAKVDVDKSINIVMQYQVMSVPTLILFVDGQALQRASGNQSRERIDEKFSSFL